MNHSKQRDLIMDFLNHTKTHPTAEEIYNFVKEGIPNISLGTVYRNLNQLSENSMILKLHTEDGIDHFDADTSEHYHFYCNRCRRVFDLSVKIPDELHDFIKNSAKNINCETEGISIFFYGKCENCKNIQYN